MTELDFLRAIHDDPDDPETYLVYADWLEDQGESTRAQLIRADLDYDWSPSRHAQSVALNQRAEDLRGQVGKTWADYKKWKKLFDVRWRWGLPSEVRSGPLPSARRIRALPEFPWVTTLSMEEAPTPEEWDLLAQRSSLHTLFLPRGAEEFEPFARLTEMRGLRSFYAQPTDADLARLAPLGQLRILDLDASAITDAGLTHLASFPLLERLRLCEARITDAGLDSLIRLGHLKDLDLRSTSITDAGLRKLSALTGLRSLELGWSGVTSASLDVLVGFKNLRRLDIARIPGIDDRTVLRLAELPRLVDLELGRTEVTRYNLRNAASKFPKLKRVQMEASMGIEGRENREIEAFHLDMEAARLLVHLDYE
jgi:uncharacterized protein (TIGR02996 family)